LEINGSIHQIHPSHWYIVAFSVPS
jgi:hypothetical protein